VTLAGLVLALLAATTWVAEDQWEGFLYGLLQMNRSLLEFAVWVAGAVFVALLVLLFWKGVLLRLAMKTQTDLDEEIVRATRLPVMLVIFLALVRTGSELTLAQAETMTTHPFWPFWQGLLYVSLVLGITFVAIAFIRAIAAWYSHRTLGVAPPAGPRRFILMATRLVKFVLFFVALTIIFGHFDIQITGLLATAGVASLAVAFAAQETLSNMIAGFVLLADRPFKVGDRVQVADGQMGDVLDIGLRRTDVLSFDNTVISLPNSEVAKSRIVNYSAPDAKFKIRAKIGVAYGSDLRKTKAVLTDIMISHPEVLKDPPPVVFFTDFADSALNLLMICGVPDYREQFRIRDELFMTIKDRFEAENISIPFPQRDVHLHAANGSPSRVSPPAWAAGPNLEEPGGDSSSPPERR
jgi:MscS family membrane protein